LGPKWQSSHTNVINSKIVNDYVHKGNEITQISHSIGKHIKYIGIIFELFAKIKYEQLNRVALKRGILK